MSVIDSLSPLLSEQCFAAGAVAGSHKRDHSYQLIVSYTKLPDSAYIVHWLICIGWREFPIISGWLGGYRGGIATWCCGTWWIWELVRTSMSSEVCGIEGLYCMVCREDIAAHVVTKTARGEENCSYHLRSILHTYTHTVQRAETTTVRLTSMEL